MEFLLEQGLHSKIFGMISFLGSSVGGVSPFSAVLFKDKTEPENGREIAET